MERSILRVFLALLLSALVIAQTPAFGPPPPIITQIIMSHSFSSDGSSFWSKNLEAFSYFPSHSGGINYTTIDLVAFDRYTPYGQYSFSRRISLPVTLPSKWVHVESSPNSLSCNLFMDQTTNMLTLLKLDRTFSTFTAVATLPLSMFTTDPAVNLAVIQLTMTIGENCELMSFVNPLLGHTAVYRQVNNFTTIQAVTLPFSSIQAMSQDMIYAIGNNKLYAYDRTTFQYVEKKSLTAHQAYTIKNQMGRIVVWGTTTTTVATSGTFLSLSTAIDFWVFHDKGTTFVEIGTIAATHLEFYRTAPVTQFTVFVSPNITKISYKLSSSSFSNQDQIVTRHVSYTLDSITPVEFTDPALFLQTLRGINLATELGFGDKYIVVRNGSKTTFGNSMNNFSYPVESTWEFDGQNFTFLKTRYLAEGNTSSPIFNSALQFNNFLRTAIDGSVTDTCVVLNLYQSDLYTTLENLVEWNFGTLMDHRKVVKPPSPHYIHFYPPPNIYWQRSSKDINQWLKFSFNTTNTNTVASIITVDNSTASHYRSVDYPLQGTSWNVIFQNPNCILFKSSDNNVHYYVKSNGNYVPVGVFSLSLYNIVLTWNTVIQLSEDCTRGHIDNYIIYFTLTGTLSFILPPGGVTIQGVDDNITYTIDSNSVIWKINPVSGTLIKAYTPPSPFPTGSKLLTSGDRLAVSFNNTSTGWFTAFTISPSTGQFQACLNYTSSSFSSSPQIVTSPLLTKVLILGPLVTTSTPKVQMFSISCPSYQTISFPTTHLKGNLPYIANMGEQFVHLMIKVRQTAQPYYEVVYFLANNAVPLTVLQRDMKTPSGVTYIKSDLWTTPQGANFLAQQYIMWNNNVVSTYVDLTELDGKKALFDNQNSGSQTSEIIDGKINLCAPGCTDCTCTNCFPKFVMETTTGRCKACAPGCQTCSSTDPTVCLTCIQGTFLNNITNGCDACNPLCETCSGTLTSCTTCPSSEFYSNGSCQPCLNNCFSCTDATTCTVCGKGFVVVPLTGQCRGCASTCSDCDPNDITKCTACAKGLFLLNNVECSPCPANCLQCSSGSICALCVPGYSANSNGVCVAKCQVPCITCPDSQPSFCLSCPLNSNAVGGVCVPSFTCNTTENCIDCGYGLNYYLALSTNGFVCTQCSSMPGCIQCDQTNPQKCSICLDGYYINSTGQCVKCHSNCAVCISFIICSKCAPGLTLKTGQTEGRCRPCLSPCATCQGSPDYCLSCVSGFTKQGWHCLNNTHTAFSLVLTSNPAIILADIDLIVCKLLAMLLGQVTTNITLDCDKRLVIIHTIHPGSVVISGTSANGTASNLQSGINSGSLGYPVTGSTISSQNNQGSSGTTTTTSQDSNIPLIVGLTVGLVLLVIIFVVITVCCLKNRQTKGRQTAGEQRNPEYKQTIRTSGNENGEMLPGSSNNIISQEKLY